MYAYWQLPKHKSKHTTCLPARKYWGSDVCFFYGPCIVVVYPNLVRSGFALRTCFISHLCYVCFLKKVDCVYLCSYFYMFLYCKKYIVAYWNYMGIIEQESADH